MSAMFTTNRAATQHTHRVTGHKRKATDSNGTGTGAAALDDHSSVDAEAADEKQRAYEMHRRWMFRDLTCRALASAARLVGGAVKPTERSLWWGLDLPAEIAQGTYHHFVSAAYHWAEITGIDRATHQQLWRWLHAVGLVTRESVFERRDDYGSNALHRALIAADTHDAFETLCADATIGPLIDWNAPDPQYLLRTPLVTVLCVGADLTPEELTRSDDRACALIDRMTDAALNAVDSKHQTALSLALSSSRPRVLRKLLLRCPALERPTAYHCHLPGRSMFAAPRQHDVFRDAEVHAMWEGADQFVAERQANGPRIVVGALADALLRELSAIIAAYVF